jgi:hypothetical protein
LGAYKLLGMAVEKVVPIEILGAVTITQNDALDC